MSITYKSTNLIQHNNKGANASKCAFSILQIGWSNTSLIINNKTKWFNRCRNKNIHQREREMQWEIQLKVLILESLVTHQTDHRIRTQQYSHNTWIILTEAKCTKDIRMLKAHTNSTPTKLWPICQFIYLYIYMNTPAQIWSTTQI